jgi:F-type H+-transporting ATPase subunit delta
MRDATIARNYAETLLVLARKAEDLRGWGKMLTDVATAMDENPTLRLFLESPKVSAEQKSAVVGKAFTDRMPRLMLRFIQSVIMHRRQMLIPEIAEEYLNLVDAAEGRMHARVTVAREMDEAGHAAIAQHLSRMFGKEVVPHVSVDP